MPDSLKTAETSTIPPASFRWFLVARGAAVVSFQMVGVAVAWQMYELTHRALDLGLVQFIPSMLLVLLVGHTADRYDRHRIIASAQLLEAMAVLLLCLGTIGDWVSREILFLFIFAVGVARAFEAPTNQTMMLSQKLQKRLFLVS